MASPSVNFSTAKTVILAIELCCLYLCPAGFGLAYYTYFT